MPTRPYPFDQLPRFAQAQLRVLDALRSLYLVEQRDAALRTAASLLGAQVSFTVGLPESQPASRVLARLNALGPFVCLILDCGAESIDAQLVVELSAGFAERMIDRTLGGENAPALAPMSLALDALSAGALAYLSARVLAALGGPLRLRHITDRSEEVAVALGAGSIAACAIDLHIDADAGSLRIYAPDALLAPTRPRPKLRSLDALPLTLIAQVGASALPLPEVRALRSGDTLVLDQSSLAFDRTEQRFTGHVIVHVAGSGTHLVCGLRDRSVEVETLTIVKEPSMTSGRVSQAPESRSTVPDVASDAPIELSVELARFSLTLGELQRTRAGDVLVTGRAIGELVTLRAAGRAIARGDLVDVDGEVGLRITEFLREV
ncbi:MAG TPA: FliM/FliN family flagellar motor switch protein [Polyangiales bacterium]